MTSEGGAAGVESSSSSSFYVRQDDGGDDDDPTPRNSSNTPKKRSIRQTFQSFGGIALPYFRESSQGRWAFCGLVVLMLLNSAVRVIFSYLARDFWSALADGDQEQFWIIVQQFLIAMICLVPINVLYTFQQNRLTIFWREWMTTRLWTLYSRNRVYYELEQQQQQQQDHNHNNSNSNKIDNPDQRMAEDIRSFTSYSLSFFLTLSLSAIDLVAFSIVLFTIRPSLFLCILGFASIGTFLTILIGKSLVRLNFQQFQKEANFRFSLVRFRENAESIAFFGGETMEGSVITQKLQYLIANSKDLIGMQRNLAFFTQSYIYITWILPIVVIAPDYFAGAVELGVIQQAVSAFGYVLSDMSVIITEFESLTQFSASVDRLVSFVQAMRSAEASHTDHQNQDDLLDLSPSTSATTTDDAQTNTMRQSTNYQSQQQHDTYYQTFSPSSSNLPVSTTVVKPRIHLHEINPNDSNHSHDTAALTIQNLCLRIPNNTRCLINNLNLTVPWGQRLLIVGPSGVGKSSLLRCIAGLWTSGSGQVLRSSDVYFLPQRPYCPTGSLRDQLLYPAIENQSVVQDGTSNDNYYEPPPPASLIHWQWSDDQLLDVLRQVNLGDLAARVGGFDTALDWSNTLSLGEQQRVAFARVLIHRPRLVILDEATSAMDVKGEAHLYDLLKSLPAKDINRKGDQYPNKTSYISVGHRPTLLAHHDVRLEILGPDRVSIHRSTGTQ